MPQKIHTLLAQYLSDVQKIYGIHLERVIYMAPMQGVTTKQIQILIFCY